MAAIGEAFGVNAETWLTTLGEFSLQAVGSIDIPLGKFAVANAAIGQQDRLAHIN